MVAGVGLAGWVRLVGLGGSVDVGGLGLFGGSVWLGEVAWVG